MELFDLKMVPPPEMVPIPFRVKLKWFHPPEMVPKILYLPQNGPNQAKRLRYHFGLPEIVPPLQNGIKFNLLALKWFYPTEMVPVPFRVNLKRFHPQVVPDPY